MDKKTADRSPRSTKDGKKVGFFGKFRKKPLWYRVFMISSAIIIVILLRVSFDELSQL